MVFASIKLKLFKYKNSPRKNARIIYSLISGKENRTLQKQKRIAEKTNATISKILLIILLAKNNFIIENKLKNNPPTTPIDTQATKTNN